MRRARGLVEFSRRDFCALAGSLALAACTQGHSGIETGPLGAGDDDGTPPDATISQDAAVDAPPAATCGTGAIDVGAPSSFVLNTPKYFSNGNLFVVRDSGGLYALTARCTHEGKTCSVQGQNIHCPRHNAFFTFDGAVVSGPVSQPLKHFAMCTLANGNVGVMTNQTVAAATRLDA